MKKRRASAILLAAVLLLAGCKSASQAVTAEERPGAVTTVPAASSAESSVEEQTEERSTGEIEESTAWESEERIASSDTAKVRESLPVTSQEESVPADPEEPSETAAETETAPREETPASSTERESIVPQTSAPQTTAPASESSTVPEETEHVHEFVLTDSKEYTCTENGYRIERCSCGAILTTTVITPGHRPGEWVTDVEPGPETEGHAYNICAVCGEKLEERSIPATGAISTDIAQAVLDLVNAERAKAGAGALSLDSSLCSASQVRAAETVTRFEHVRPDGRDCFSVLDEFGIGWTACGENIAAGQATPEEVVEAWMNSEGHRKNILNADFTHMGLGYVENPAEMYRFYWAQMFIRK